MADSAGPASPRKTPASNQDSDESGIPTVEMLVAETQLMRQALHALVERLRGERRLWERDLLALPHRTRLTSAQRELFRRQLAARPSFRR